MALITILETQICDEDQNQLPYDATLGAFRVQFDPKINGTSPLLKLKVKIGLNPVNSTQVRLTLTEGNLADFRFTMGDGQKINYYREVVHESIIYLPFRNKTLKNVSDCFLSSLRLTAIDSVNPQGKPQKTTRIKAY